MLGMLGPTDVDIWYDDVSRRSTTVWLSSTRVIRRDSNGWMLVSYGGQNGQSRDCLAPVEIRVWRIRNASLARVALSYVSDKPYVTYCSNVMFDMQKLEQAKSNGRCIYDRYGIRMFILSSPWLFIYNNIDTTIDTARRIISCVHSAVDVGLRHSDWARFEVLFSHRWLDVIIF